MIRWILNRISCWLGYGTCPNCDDGWWWKKLSDGIIYEEDRGIALCKECKSYPDKLIIFKITDSLQRSGWPLEKVQKVENAVRAFKNNALKTNRD